jgi:hypothetical protein
MYEHIHHSHLARNSPHKTNIEYFQHRNKLNMLNSNRCMYYFPLLNMLLKDILLCTKNKTDDAHYHIISKSSFISRTSSIHLNKEDIIFQVLFWKNNLDSLINILHQRNKNHHQFYYYYYYYLQSFHFLFIIIIIIWITF